jgi:uncharacterized damage-inducible protein DinB
MAEQALIDELNEKMAEERDKLLSALEALGEEQAERSTTGEGEWSAKQQMSHLCEMDSAYRAWVEKALAEDGADLDGLFGEPVAIPLERAHEHSVAEHAAELRRQRELTLAMMSRMTPADYDRTARNRIFGSLTVLQWLRSYYRHDRMHYDQVRGQEPTYKPRYSTGSEPDQRRSAASG